MKRIIGECPLGSKCESVETRNNEQVIVICPWYACADGQDSQGNKLDTEWRCGIAWMPTLMLEMAGTNRGQTQAIESFRNESVKGQETFNNLIQQKIALNNKLTF